MGSDVTGFSQSVESKSDKRSTELHHHSFNPEEISALSTAAAGRRSFILILKRSLFNEFLTRLSKTLLLTLLIATR